MMWTRKVKKEHECSPPERPFFGSWKGVGSLWTCRKCKTVWEVRGTYLNPFKGYTEYNWVPKES